MYLYKIILRHVIAFQTSQSYENSESDLQLFRKALSSIYCVNGNRKMISLETSAAGVANNCFEFSNMKARHKTLYL